MENNTETNNNIKEGELNILDLVKTLWSKKNFIIKFTLVFFAIGLFIAIFSSKVYTASSVVVPQIGRANSIQSSIAALAGIDLNRSSSSDVLSPYVYDKILNNVDFQRELVNTPLTFNDQDTSVKIIDYYTNSKYKKFSLLGAVKKYTLGLPGVIIGLLKGKQKQVEYSDNSDSIYVANLTPDEYICLNAFKGNYNMDIDGKNGYITIKASMSEPIAAAQVTQSIVALLQKYITKFKIEKAEANYEFIKKRYDEAVITYKEKQEEYAKFLDANKGLSTAVSKAKEDVVKNEYTVASAMYNQLLGLLLQAELKVKEDTPILTVVVPVVVPKVKSAPQRGMIIFAFIFLGVAFSSGLILGVDWLKKNNLSRRWIDNIIK